jgi:hypothetical protein
MAHLDESNAILPLAEGFDDSIDAVAGQSEHYIHTPRGNGFDQYVGSIVSHRDSFTPPVDVSISGAAIGMQWCGSLLPEGGGAINFRGAAGRERGA